jgi:plastocyanin
MFIRKQLKYIFGPALAVALLLSGCNSDSSTTGSGQNQGPSFNSGTIAAGGTYSYTFDEVGSVDYYCEIHSPDMQGRITVSSNAEAAAQDTVIMNNQQFQPSSLTVAPNTEVIWINNENVSHTVTSGNPSDDDDDDGGY